MDKRKIFISAFLLICFIMLMSQEEEVENEQQVPEKFNRLETLANQQEEEVKVEIRKPDNASLMTRRPTQFEIGRKFKAYGKLKKSNLLIY